MSAISYAEIGRHDGPSRGLAFSASSKPFHMASGRAPTTHELNLRLLTPSTPLDVSAGRATSSRVLSCIT